MLMAVSEVTDMLPHIMANILLLALQVGILVCGSLLALRFCCYLLSCIRKDLDKTMRKVYKDGY